MSHFTFFYMVIVRLYFIGCERLDIVDKVVIDSCVWLMLDRVVLSFFEHLALLFENVHKNVKIVYAFVLLDEQRICADPVVFSAVMLVFIFLDKHYAAFTLDEATLLHLS